MTKLKVSKARVSFRQAAALLITGAALMMAGCVTIPAPYKEQGPSMPQSGRPAPYGQTSQVEDPVREANIAMAQLGYTRDIGRRDSVYCDDRSCYECGDANANLGGKMAWDCRQINSNGAIVQNGKRFKIYYNPYRNDGLGRTGHIFTAPGY